MLAQFPDLAFEQVSLQIGHDFWVVESRMSGTFAGAETSFDVDLIDLIIVEDGLIKSKDSYLDAVSMQAPTRYRSRAVTTLDSDGCQGVRRVVRSGLEDRRVRPGGLSSAVSGRGCIPYTASDSAHPTAGPSIRRTA